MKNGKTDGNPLSVVETAVQNGNLQPEVLEKLLNLQERWNKSQDQLELQRRLAAAKARFGKIKKTKKY